MLTDNKRSYYRFRAAKFYGGIATADCVGCNLKCWYCWSKAPRDEPEKYGRFYSPEEVASKLISIAKNNGFKQVRVSGNEPTLCREHLLKVIELIPTDLLFILETNGIELGRDESFVRELARFKNLHVRLCLKGTNRQNFAKITKAPAEWFDLQLRAAEYLKKFRVSFHMALMAELFSREEIDDLFAIWKINPSEVEFERLVRYRR